MAGAEKSTDYGALDWGYCLFTPAADRTVTRARLADIEDREAEPAGISLGHGILNRSDPRVRTTRIPGSGDESAPAPCSCPSGTWTDVDGDRCADVPVRGGRPAAGAPAGCGKTVSASSPYTATGPSHHAL
ncbi:hypothetical protein [Streptomyces sp. NRRL S-340]|uniref:hypothetical protein n=1 Tax=Streptomyces sp. NRRL S-340 TaxID=1463901 RepID=UPI00055E9188|nr:hypothetical protein [Streptomyces sp. NRRL S-340]